MPKLSDTMEYGILLKWYKKVGDPLRNGDILAEVETDKATLELENFDDGVLSAIYANEGDQVAVGAPLALVGKVEKEFRISENFSAPIQTDLSKFKTSRIYLTRRSMVYGPYSIESIHQFLDIGLYKTHEYAWAPHMNRIMYLVGSTFRTMSSVVTKSFRSKGPRFDHRPCLLGKSYSFFEYQLKICGIRRLFGLLEFPIRAFIVHLNRNT
jgi:hypothetical protein